MGAKRNLETVAQNVRALAGESEWDRAWKAAGPIIRAQRTNDAAAKLLLELVTDGAFGSRGLDGAKKLFDAHPDRVPIISALGGAIEAIHDIRYLNDEPPSDRFFVSLAAKLQSLLEKAPDPDAELTLLYPLATVARVLGRNWDEVTERVALRIVELVPDRWQSHYDLGLFYKTRGRFAEGQAANQRAMDRGGSESDSVVWNLGICATGAGDTDAALAAWHSLGQKIERGRFGLPEGKYPATKVRLARRPLAERNPEEEPDDPGEEETIWVERLSPCHGIVRSALYEDAIGVDFGDVVLFDGAAITMHTIGERSVPVFPHLVTLRRTGYRIFRFHGTQRDQGQIASLSDGLPEDSVLYVHTEQLTMLCRACWEDPDADHHGHDPGKNTVVSGKLCAPPTIAASDLLAALDRAAAAADGVCVLVPDLCRAAGDDRRAEVEERRTGMLLSAS